jgi:hypothetical protein
LKSLSQLSSTQQVFPFITDFMDLLTTCEHMSIAHIKVRFLGSIN